MKKQTKKRTKKRKKRGNIPDAKLVGKYFLHSHSSAEKSGRMRETENFSKSCYKKQQNITRGAGSTHKRIGF